MAEASVPKGVIDFEDINGEKGAYSQSMLYSQSKAGNIFLGWEFAGRSREDGLISVVRSFNVHQTGKGSKCIGLD
jgi:retinol dehydrogenase-12